MKAKESRVIEDEPIEATDTPEPSEAPEPAAPAAEPEPVAPPDPTAPVRSIWEGSENWSCPFHPCGFARLLDRGAVVDHIATAHKE